MFPALLGHEGAGVVIAVGEGVTRSKVGDHVIFNWVPFCGACVNCKRGETWLCGNGYGLGMAPATFDGGMAFPMAGTGTFCEEAVVHESSAIPIAQDVPLDIAALVGCGVTTGVGAALNTANVAKGSTVLVIGCGGVGINVIQGAKIAGARAIVAMDRLENKAEDAKRFGATHAATPEDTAPAIQAEAHRQRGLRLRVRGHRAVIDDPRRVRRHAQGRHVRRRRGRSPGRPVSFNGLEFLLKEPQDPRMRLRVVAGRQGLPDKFLSYWREGKLDLEGLISKHISIEDVPSAFEAMERGEVIRSVIRFD